MILPSRHLMESKSNRSWVKTYTQMWTLDMCDPLNQTHGFSHNHNTVGQSQQRKFVSGSGSGPGKPKYCWKFNKNRQHNANCSFMHKCIYCDASDHARLNCPKRSKESGSKQ